MNKSRLRILSINLIILVAIAAVGYWGYSTIHPKAAAAAISTATVTRGDVSATVSSSGTVVSPSDIALAPATSGVLAALNVKVGQSVHAGEVLAQMDTTSLKSSVAQAQASLIQAQANLSNAQATADTNSATSAITLQNDQNAVTTAQSNYAYQQTLINASQATDLENVQTALTKLNNDKTTTSQNVAVYQSTVDSAKNNLTNAQLTLTDFLGVYGPPMGLITAAYCANINTISSTCTTFTQDNNAVINAQSAYNNALITQQQNLAKDAQTIASDQQSYNDALATAALNQKKNVQTLATAQAQIDSAQSALKLYQLQNANSTTASTIAIDQAQVTVAQSNLVTAQKNLAGATVTAPVSGKVASISNTLIGATISPNTTPTNGSTSATGFIVLTDVGGLQVTAGFSESDVAKIAVGQTASIAFTALPNETGAAKVSSVALLPTTSSGATTYTVTFQLTGKVAGLKPGMTATATVVVADSPNAISVTSRAVTTRGNNSFVNVVTTVKGKQVETPTPVVIGVVGDSSDEILSGLKEGQLVALPSVTSSSTSSSLTGVPSTLGGAGLGGGGFGGGRAGGGGFGG
jgi:multidrug efflux pump subunit AcrA (membrane-fusion protein)